MQFAALLAKKPAEASNPSPIHAYIWNSCCFGVQSLRGDSWLRYFNHLRSQRLDLADLLRGERMGEIKDEHINNLQNTNSRPGAQERARRRLW